MKRVKLLKNGIVNKLITGLSCLVLVIYYQCDNEQTNPARLSFKKATARLSFFGGYETGISFDKWEKIKKVKLTISTDEKGDIPAKYYKDMNDLTGKDLKDVIFPINEDEIQVLLEATSKGKDYYIQIFCLLDDNENLLYFNLGVQKFTLKRIDNPPIVVNVIKFISPTFDRATPEFSVKSMDDHLVFFGFQNYTNDYFNSKKANIDLNISLNDQVNYHVNDVFLAGRKLPVVFNRLPIFLPETTSSYTGTFKVEAKVHDYPTKGVTHDFAIPADVSEQIKKGNVLLRVLNHNPKLFINADKDSIQIDLSTDTEVNIPFNITDEDSDETQYAYLCRLIKKSNYETVRDLSNSESDGYIIFRAGINNISFSTDKLKTKEGKAIAQDDLQNYIIGVFFFINDKLYYSDILSSFININP